MSYRFADSLRAGSGQKTLHVSDSSSVHHQEFFTVHTEMVNVIQVCWQLASRLRTENSPCFGQFLCPSSGVFHSKHSNGICHTGLLTACRQDKEGTAVPSWSCSQAVSKTVWHIILLCVQWKTSDDGQRNCPKHVEFYSKKQIWEISAFSWFYCKTLSRCTVTWTSNLKLVLDYV